MTLEELKKKQLAAASKIANILQKLAHDADCWDMTLNINIDKQRIHHGNMMISQPEVTVKLVMDI